MMDGRRKERIRNSKSGKRGYLYKTRREEQEDYKRTQKAGESGGPFHLLLLLLPRMSFLFPAATMYRAPTCTLAHAMATSGHFLGRFQCRFPEYPGGRRRRRERD